MPLDLEAIKARRDAATPTPWSDFCESGDWWIQQADPVDGDPIGAVICDANDMGEGDMLFIAHARQDVDDLIQEVERLRAIETAARALLGPAESGRETVARWEVLRTALEAETGRLRGLTDLIRAVESRGWLWEGGHSQGPSEPGRHFYARLWLPSLDPMHDEEPWVDERLAWGDTPEEAAQRAIAMLPSKGE